jgi:hypothetical protein
LVQMMVERRRIMSRQLILVWLHVVMARLGVRRRSRIDSVVKRTLESGTNFGHRLDFFQRVKPHAAPPDKMKTPDEHRRRNVHRAIPALTKRYFVRVGKITSRDT